MPAVLSMDQKLSHAKPSPLSIASTSPREIEILLLFLKLVSLDIELMYVLRTSTKIIELRCGQVIELWSAKEKTCTCTPNPT